MWPVLLLKAMWNSWSVLLLETMLFVSHVTPEAMFMSVACVTAKGYDGVHDLFLCRVPYGRCLWSVLSLETMFILWQVLNLEFVLMSLGLDAAGTLKL